MAMKKKSQPSGYKNPFAKGSTPKGYVSEKITTKSGKTVILTGKVKPGASSGYLNPNAAGNKKAAPKPKATPSAKGKAPSTWAQRQKKAEADLLKKRKAESKRTGTWPNYGTN